MPFAVVDAREECYAIEIDLPEATWRAAQAVDYLDEAEASGHPGARAWTTARRPIRVVPVTPEEALAMREASTPILEVEP